MNVFLKKDNYIIVILAFKKVNRLNTRNTRPVRKCYSVKRETREVELHVLGFC